MPYRPVANYIQATSDCAKSGESAAVVAEKMRSRATTHVPVIEEGVLKGVLSERSLAMFESRSEVSLAQLTVADLVYESAYSVTPSAPLTHVLLCMAQHGYDCAVIMEQNTILGVLSLRDAVRAAADSMLETGELREEVDLETARALALGEHEHVKTLLSQAQTAARRLEDGDGSPQEISSVHACTRHLVSGMRSLLALEDRVLAPVLAEVPGFGAERVRQLSEQHGRQAKETESVLSALEDPGTSFAALAERIGRSLTNLRRALADEERLLLDAEVLEGGVASNVEAG